MSNTESSAGIIVVVIIIFMLLAAATSDGPLYGREEPDYWVEQVGH
jgi:hypothetical protein